MSEIRNYRDLDARKAAIDLVLSVYGIAQTLAPSERYRLAGQMRRAAVSVPSNIAEGQAGGPRRRYLHHVRIAQGSLAELDTQLEVSVRLEFVSAVAVSPLEIEIRRTAQLLYGLARALRTQSAGWP